MNRACNLSDDDERVICIYFQVEKPAPVGAHESLRFYLQHSARRKQQWACFPANDLRTSQLESRLMYTGLIDGNYNENNLEVVALNEEIFLKSKYYIRFQKYSKGLSDGKRFFY